MYHHTLRQIIQIATPQIESLSAMHMHDKPSPEKWSKKEILGHLIDSAYNNHQRFLRAGSQEDLIFQGYDQNDWVIKNNYQNRSEKEVLALWANANLHMCALIESISETILSKETTNHNFHKIGMKRPEEGSTSSLSYLIWDYIFHLEHHLSQIIPNYEKINPPFV
jgi:hypothetical protein